MIALERNRPVSVDASGRVIPAAAIPLPAPIRSAQESEYTTQPTAAGGVRIVDRHGRSFGEFVNAGLAQSTLAFLAR